MDHLRTVIRKLDSFGEGDFRQSGRARADARIGGEDAIDIGPYPDFVGAQRGAEERGGVIRATATERGEMPRSGGSAISGDDRHLAGFEQRVQHFAAALPCFFQVRRGVAVVLVGDHQFGGIDVIGGDAARAQIRGADLR